MKYHIRNANTQDIPVILSVYAAARAFMIQSGNPNQWGMTNPRPEQLKTDIADGVLYVVEDDSGIHGVFAFIIGEDPTYEIIYHGAWNYDTPYGTIHRIASDGSGGIFSAAQAFCAAKCEYLRIDTHRDNSIMQHLITKNGFKRCGIIHIADGSERIAYDRML